MSESPTLPLDQIEGPWEDEVIELRIIRVLQPGDTSVRSPETEFLAKVPEARFAIHRRSDGLRVGRIHLRVTDDPTILDILGHGGYAVDPQDRRRGYATRAIRLLAQVARVHALKRLLLHIEPQNTPSRRAIERAGFRLVAEADSPPEAVAIGVGPRICHYGIEL